MSGRGPTVGGMGEAALIARLVELFPRPPHGELWSGDDAAAPAWSQRGFLLTIDALVEGVDFDLGYAGGSDVGWKAVAVNVSDVAAMGGSPVYAVATLCLPSTTPLAVVDAIGAGMAEAVNHWEMAVVGGDISRASEISVTLALVGRAYAEPVRRSGATPGDAIGVTGSLGGARAGLEILKRGDRGHEEVVRRQLRPEARVREAEVLVGEGVTAMIDVSDGLAMDLSRVMEASGTGCEVDPGSLPVDPNIASTGLDGLETAIVGGEDFELLFTVPDAGWGRVEDAMAAVGTDVTRIGSVTSGETRIGDEPLDDWKERGWDHLQNP